MAKRDKMADAAPPNPETVKSAEAQKLAPHARGPAPAWANARKLPDASKKMSARHKVPFGPLGGSGRKTNLSRSS